ncbi:alpha/beta hydrolase [Sagittula stellata]|uniref:Probable acetyl xylan esterase n=2 Tax=Sagittula stellata TaxID=52603 RepID=A3K5Y3_SAGS3|nr:alpha/beta hydrolase [Sagittula stellata]EBA07522.1 probable acetyl xylan esterase [Sagittula stellata E-37]
MAGCPLEAWTGLTTLPAEACGVAGFDALYGAVPAPPDAVSFERIATPEPGLERIVIEVTVGGRHLRVDAGLWVPDGPGPFPLVAGLDFVGPLGIAATHAFPRDPGAVVQAPEVLGGHGRLEEFHRGATAYRWPVTMLCNRGHAVLVSCYGSWVPDSATQWHKSGARPLTGATDAGAISLWAWAIMRLLDVAERLPGIDPGRLAVAGHSRLGKAALWAAAQDSRIAAVWANASGCCGAAPEAHGIGETRAQLVRRFPHWLRQGTQKTGDFPDQQALLALCAQRRLYLSGAVGDLWADPVGSYLALAMASGKDWPDVPTMWEQGGQIVRGLSGWHLRPGGHEMLPHDWRCFLHFLDVSGY